MYPSMIVGMLFIVLNTGDGKTTDKPMALRKAMENRSALRLQTARIEYSVIDNREGEYQHQSQFYTFKAADNDYIMVHQGNQDCIVARDVEGAALPVSVNKPWHCLYQNGAVWQHPQDSPDAQVLGEEAGLHGLGMHDLRELGLNPLFVGENIDDYIRNVGYPPLE